MKYADVVKVAQQVDAVLAEGFHGQLRMQSRMAFAEVASAVSSTRTEERERAYAAIDSERNYQDKRWGRVKEKIGDDAMLTGSSTLGQGVGNRSLDEFVLYMDGYLRDLAHLASHTNDPEPKLEFVRKVTALGVACMEQHGAPLRKPT